MVSDNVVKTYEGKVVEENGEMIVVFPPEMLFELGWAEGDTVVWDIQDDAIVVRRVAAE